jgi:hypothetical protein
VRLLRDAGWISGCYVGIVVTPAQAGIQRDGERRRMGWIPAFAGMTSVLGFCK